MASFNKVILLGNLTRDPEVRYTPKGSAVCDLGIGGESTITRSIAAKNAKKSLMSMLFCGRDWRRSPANI